MLINQSKLSTKLVIFITLNLSLTGISSILALDLNADDHDGHEGYETWKHYTRTWAVHIPNGDQEHADQVAEKYGFVKRHELFDDLYVFEHKSVVKRSADPSHYHQNILTDDDRVNWSKQMVAKSRKKRDLLSIHQPKNVRNSDSGNGRSISLNDPKWKDMWYLNRGEGLDMNVIPVWKQGITGKGIVVAVLDDGVEWDHPDLHKNYNSKLSYDVNDNDNDSMPRYNFNNWNRHGTRCAGVIGAIANNTVCGTGIAFNADIVGVRMLDGDVTDAVEAKSLSLNPQGIDIYTASWGPDDDGKTVDGPGRLAKQALIYGITKGRNGKGNIFVWASGGGGKVEDNCNCDGYTNSIWTLTISSVTEKGNIPFYSEKCSATLASTYSSGESYKKRIIRTDLRKGCTDSFTGTSASAPLAAGIIALVLEANRDLTWRDIQHIVVRTANPNNLNDSTWTVNGVGRKISHSFGYGLMDAAAMVKLARNWRTVPEQIKCEIQSPHENIVILPKRNKTFQLNVNLCNGIKYLEHIQANITLTTSRRSDVHIYLKSPAGTKVTLLTQRSSDSSRAGFDHWPFMSVFTWGESPIGIWELEIHNEGKYYGRSTLKEWNMIFYGTRKSAQVDDPKYRLRVPRK